jgi:hypothetical protein
VQWLKWHPTAVAKMPVETGADVHKQYRLPTKKKKQRNSQNQNKNFICEIIFAK